MMPAVVNHEFICGIADDAQSAAAGKVLPSHWNANHVVVDGVPGYQPNQVLSGGGVAWVSGLTFDVAATSYIIQNTVYSSAQTQLTLSAAHATLDRIDVIAVDNTGTAIVIEGTASATPIKPDVDDASQLELTFISIPATATSATVTTVDIYHENTEWTSSKSGAPITLASTSGPHLGSVCVDGAAATTGNYFQFQNGSSIDLATYNNGALIFYVKSKATWPSTRSIQIRWQLSGTQKGSVVTLRGDGTTFGFNSSNITTYQLVSIPLSLFGANGNSINQVRFTVGGTGGTIGFKFDDCIIQSTVVPTTPPTGVTSFNGRAGAVTLLSADLTGLTHNGYTFTSVAAATLTIANGKTLTASNSITLAGTDSTTMTFPPASASIGYLNIPQNSQSTAYTTVLADAGKHIFHPSSDASARTFTIDSNANVAYPVGTAITFINQNGAGTVTIAITSDTMRLAGVGTTGSRTLAANGVCTAVKVASTEWIISGTGLS